MWNDNAVIIMRSSRIAGADFSPPTHRMKGKKNQAFSTQSSFIKRRNMHKHRQHTKYYPSGCRENMDVEIELVWKS